MTIYLQVKLILEKYPYTREDDRLLEWMYLVENGYVKDGVLSKEDFISAPPMESIRRQRQKIQNDEHKLEASLETKHQREEKQKRVENEVRKEKTWFYDYVNNTCYMK